MLSLPRGRSPRRRTADMVAAEALRPDDDADVYAFTQLELPELAAGTPSPSSPIGEASLKVKNGVYLGLRPGAVSKLDDSYFAQR